MNPYIQQFESAVAERFSVVTVRQQGVVQVQCFNKDGQLISSRALTERQLKNTALLSAVLADLKLELDKNPNHPPLTPLPDTHNPSAS
ncbi:hypothetical protein SRABI70_01980 [Pseudomonas sp. Bi70]|uniref:hypothetical protein n=1 Tax=Pseudomonas sp. Bi70 TaxID=2821127 RepID=UPI001D1E723B|nr:hypothetical protein [Pseudomonas sp. Bi70]CAH0210658.1 hypothetical protein SRABI70_01980 [Pseudomonas sp. Bi70]